MQECLWISKDGFRCKIDCLNRNTVKADVIPAAIILGDMRREIGARDEGKPEQRQCDNRSEENNRDVFQQFFQSGKQFSHFLVEQTETRPFLKILVSAFTSTMMS